MNKKHISSVLSLFVLFLSCTVPQMKVADTLQAKGERFAVSGRQGLMFNRTIRFGQFSTLKIKQGWQSGRENESRTTSFFSEKTHTEIHSKQKTYFSLVDGEGNSSAVNLISKISLDVDEKESFFTFFQGWKEKSIQVNDDVYGGEITINDSATWQFVLVNSHNLDESSAKSLAKCGDKEIAIRENREVNVKSSMLTDLSGYEFVLNGTVIGAVDVINNGAVWINKSISADDKFVVANIATAILIRMDLYDEN